MLSNSVPLAVKTRLTSRHLVQVGFSYRMTFSRFTIIPPHSPACPSSYPSKTQVPGEDDVVIHLRYLTWLAKSASSGKRQCFTTKLISSNTDCTSRTIYV
jgi:hypothetical protein